MSFHPLMVYDSDHFHKSERARLDEGTPFEFTRERRARLDDMLTKYPPDQNDPRCSVRCTWCRSRKAI